jgi:DNA-binding beta-propeller fold protein YncE
MNTAIGRRLLLSALLLTVSSAVTAQVRIVQTNSQGDNIHLIDPATNTIAGEIKGVPINHGAAALPDGSLFFFSSEAEQTLHVVDGKSLQTTKKIPLTGRPNNISISKDGARVYVGIVSSPGAVDVIDTRTLERVKSIPMKGGIHNVYVTPDGKYLVAGSIAGRLMTVVDQKTDEPLWTLFEEGVRPMAFEVNPDGSTRRIFVQLSEVHGFAIVDFHQRKEVGRITLPNDVPAEKVDKGPFNASPSHGIGVAPDGKTLWVTSRPNARVYTYSLPDLKLLPNPVDLGGRPDWVTVHAGQQVDLHHDREYRSRSRHRCRVAQGSRADQSRQVAEAQYHGGDSLGVRYAVVVSVSRGGCVDDCGHDSRTSRRRTEDELPEGEGKKILVASCTSCHDLSEVTKFRGYYDRRQWRDIVVTMMDYGAPVNEKQVDVLADYLAEHLGKP